LPDRFERILSTGAIRAGEYGGEEMVEAATTTLSRDSEKLLVNDISVRTTLTFSVADAAIQMMLPAGWKSTSGPIKDSNLTVILIDTVIVQDPEGNPIAPQTVVVLATPAKRVGSDETVPMVIGGFLHGSIGPYEVYNPAELTVDRRSRTDAAGLTTLQEAWHAKADDGEALEVQTEFTRGALSRDKFEAKIYSAAKPDFYRIYRVEQLTDVARSVPVGIDRVSKFYIQATGRKLSRLFDGSEHLISVSSIPVYRRSLSLPIH
jgi:hypothetical protein